MSARMLCTLAVFALAMPVFAADQDDNIEWAGISHIDWLDRSPRCPVDGESFDIRFQCWHYDLTSARVHVDTGSVTWVTAGFLQQRGPYDIWTATLPASASAGTVEYYIELTDGTDTDYLGPDGVSDNAPSSGWVVDFATLSHAPLGGTLTSDGGAVFKVWSLYAGTCAVAGEFNGWSSTADYLTRSGDFFIGRVDPTVDNYDQYKYVFNGSTWKPDARGRAWNPSDNNNSYIVDPEAYAWDDDEFVVPDVEDMVIYELHVGTFSGYNDGVGGMGTFRDVVDAHLDHLLYLGVNMVELMPITEFDYYESWGYNPVNNWGPEEAYGTPDDFKYMVDVLHQNGIAVMIDIVYNHFSYNGNELWYYDGSQIYFDNPACDTPWGSQADFRVSAVRDYYADNVLYWMDEYHIDGFRMDATSYMRDPLGCYSEGWALMQRINDEIDNRKVDAVAIAEELPDNAWITRDTGDNGAGFDSQWHDLFNDDVRQEIFDASYGNPEMWKIRDVLRGKINDGSSTFIEDWGQTTTQLMNYVESHDEADDARLASVIDGSNAYSDYAKGRSKLAQGLTILAPGIPMFLMGGEWLEDITFDSGYSNRIDWSKATSRAPIVLFFRDVINIKKDNGGFRSDAGYQVHHVDDTNNVIAFHRWDLDGNDLIVVANFSNSDYTGYRVGFPQEGTWSEILNSQASDYLGNGVGNGGSITATEYTYDSMSYSAEIVVPQMGLLVFRYGGSEAHPGDMNCDGNVNFDDIDAFVTALVSEDDYNAQYGGCRWLNADCTGDNTVNFDDIDCFVDLLVGG